MEKKQNRERNGKNAHPDVAKWYLLRLADLTEQMEDVRDSIAVLKAQSTRTTAWLDPIGGSKNSGKHDFSDLVIQMEEKKELYRTLVEHHSLMFVQISRIIDNVEDKRIRIVLRKKYLELCSVATIAQQLDRSEKHIYRLLKEGLQVIKLPDSVYKEYEHRPRYFQR